MGIHIVPVVAPIIHFVIKGFFPEFWSIITVPFCFIFSTHLMRKSACIITWNKIDTWLRRVTEIELACIKNTFWAHEPGQLGCLCAKSEERRVGKECRS